MPIKSTILSQFDIDVDLPNAWILALMDRFLRAKLMPLNKPPVEVAEPNVHQMPLRGKPTKDPRYLPTTFLLSWAVVVVKWSACLPSTLTIWVWIPLMPTVFSVKFVFEKNKSKQKRGWGWLIFKVPLKLIGLSILLKKIKAILFYLDCLKLVDSLPVY